MWHVAYTGEIENAYRLFGYCGGNPEEKQSLGRPRRRWKDNI